MYKYIYIVSSRLFCWEVATFMACFFPRCKNLQMNSVGSSGFILTVPQTKWEAFLNGIKYPQNVYTKIRLMVGCFNFQPL